MVRRLDAASPGPTDLWDALRHAKNSAGWSRIRSLAEDCGVSYRRLGEWGIPLGSLQAMRVRSREPCMVELREDISPAAIAKACLRARAVHIVLDEWCEESVRAALLFGAVSAAWTTVRLVKSGPQTIPERLASIGLESLPILSMDNYRHLVGDLQESLHWDREAAESAPPALRVHEVEEQRQWFAELLGQVESGSHCRKAPLFRMLYGRAMKELAVAHLAARRAGREQTLAVDFDAVLRKYDLLLDDELCSTIAVRLESDQFVEEVKSGMAVALGVLHGEIERRSQTGSHRTVSANPFCSLLGLWDMGEIGRVEFDALQDHATIARLLRPEHLREAFAWLLLASRAMAEVHDELHGAGLLELESRRRRRHAVPDEEDWPARRWRRNVALLRTGATWLAYHVERQSPNCADLLLGALNLRRCLERPDEVTLPMCQEGSRELTSDAIPLGRKICRHCRAVSFDTMQTCPACGRAAWWWLG